VKFFTNSLLSAWDGRSTRFSTDEFALKNCHKTVTHDPPSRAYPFSRIKDCLIYSFWASQTGLIGGQIRMSEMGRQQVMGMLIIARPGMAMSTFGLDTYLLIMMRSYVLETSAAQF
jgi:hypothetical protein